MTRSNKDLLIEAQKEQRAELGKRRVSVLEALDELTDFGGQDSYEDSLLAIATKYGEKGVSLTRVRTVLPDSGLLKTAIANLESTVKVEGAGKSAILKLKN